MFLLLSVGIEEALALAEDLRKCVAERTVSYLNNKIQYTISAGIACCPNNQYELTDLLKKADLALYKAKRHGKNSISTYTID